MSRPDEIIRQVKEAIRLAALLQEARKKLCGISMKSGEGPRQAVTIGRELASMTVHKWSDRSSWSVATVSSQNE